MGVIVGRVGLFGVIVLLIDMAAKTSYSKDTLR